MARPAPAVHLEDVEILVHIAAPSKAPDDARYRHLAQAYLAFRPDTRADIVSSTRDRHGGVGPAGETPAPEPDHPQQRAPGSHPPAPTASPPCLVPESQELSFDGALGNHGSFRARDARHPAPSPARSWRTPPSHISDSYPLPDASLVASSRAAALEICLLPYAPRDADADANADAPAQRQASPAAQAPAEDVQVPSSIPVPDSQGRPANGNLASQHGPQTIPIPIPIPVTPSLLGGAPQRKRKRKASSETCDQPIIERTSLSTCPSSSSDDDATHISDSFPLRAESAPPASKRPKPSPHALLVRSTSDAGPAAADPLPAPELAGGKPRAAADLALALALEIRSPSPAPGLSDIHPADLVSPKLAELARRLHSRFRPRCVRPPPEPLERGYWLADCAAWPCHVRAGAWRFLADYFASGLAGWGVWCRRDEAHGWIRLYCWGHVVEHMYLLLYLASNRELKKTGARWFDGDGELVLEVLPHEKQKRGVGEQTEEQREGRGEERTGGRQTT